MKKVLFIQLFIITFQIVNAQIFEKGYYIDNSGQKYDVLIKNYDWKYNPTEIEIKNSPDGEIIIKNILNIEEFGILNTAKYIKSEVKLDMTKSDFLEIDKDRNPKFENHILLLKKVIEGKANLYRYEEEKMIRYFYQIDNDSIIPLVYKKYYVNSNSYEFNEFYKQQLKKDLQCNTMKDRSFEILEYNIISLSNLFNKYNECVGSQTVDYEKNKKRDVFNMWIKPGLSYASLSVDHSFLGHLDFNPVLAPTAGIEFEYIFPFNNNQLSFSAEPTYKQFKLNLEKDNLKYEVNYKAVDIPFSLKYIFDIKGHYDPFLKGSWVYTKTIESSLMKVKFTNGYLDYSLYANSNFAVGVGTIYKNKFSVELNYNTKKNLFSLYQTLNSNFGEINLEIGYNVF